VRGVPHLNAHMATKRPLALSLLFYGVVVAYLAVKKRAASKRKAAPEGGAGGTR